MYVGDPKDWPPCTRCGRELLYSLHVSLGDGVQLELCQLCDVEVPYAAELVMMLATGLIAAERVQPALTVWMHGAMAARGWYHHPHGERVDEGPVS
ncbi:DUF6300 family protein [Streptomyces sp. CB03911]|uniref:DUF6300 family protein n=1 Tax=Streptomyces sp. CB03911 TaxID=1804758 RepID=UPI0025704163|nr:DUF6300 family protein [Streptomyces sp. CB03911]